MNMDGLKIIAAVVGMLTIAGMATSRPSSEKVSQAEVPAPSPCKSDWTKCADNSDMANNFGNWVNGRTLCKRAANEHAKYGDPVWPWYHFGSFRSGTDFVTSGVATLIEKDAQFSNGFGAMQHVKVICTYDLHTKKVTNVYLETER